MLNIEILQECRVPHGLAQFVYLTVAADRAHGLWSFWMYEVLLFLSCSPVWLVSDYATAENLISIRPQVLMMQGMFINKYSKQLLHAVPQTDISKAIIVSAKSTVRSCCNSAGGPLLSF